jgi:hypothetical protein
MISDNTESNRASPMHRSIWIKRTPNQLYTHKYIAKDGLSALTAVLPLIDLHCTAEVGVGVGVGDSLTLGVSLLMGSCNSCQCSKLPCTGCGELTPRNPQVAPRCQVAIDLLGPWKTNVNVNGQELTFRALTIISINTVMNYCENYSHSQQVSRSRRSAIWECLDLLVPATGRGHLRSRRCIY